MGTLTAGTVRLPGHCDHKLPASCRLTSILECCACADERAHAPSYAVYIDGIGFVPRGTRWQRYCWFCKEFWENRVAASGLRPAQTRIPGTPDQTAFLERWYEFHHGYRIVKKDDGTEERIAVLGEEFREVSPGLLPRTLEELRAGRERNILDEFWENRVAASGLRPAQTRIPGTPDQTAFLERWYEFHHGYRIVKKDDGTEERIAVLGEEFREVSPGLLPRTLEELRAGRERNILDEVQQPVAEIQSQAEAGPTLEDTLDSLFLAASAEESQQSQPSNQILPALEHDINPERRETAVTPSNVHAQSMTAANSRNQEYQARRVAALRRELSRMRNGIERVLSGLRELGEEVPGPVEATRQLTELGHTLDTINGVPSQEAAVRAINSVNTLTSDTRTTHPDRTLANVQARIDSARQHVDEARRARDQAASELDLADQEFRTSQQRLQQLQREQRTTENYIRLFGTREEMAAQGENYESPIGALFSRAYDRFRAAEQVRQDERTLRQVLEDEARSGGEVQARQLAELESRHRDVWGVPQLLPNQRESANEADHGNAAIPTTERLAWQGFSSLSRGPDRFAVDHNGQVLSSSEPAGPSVAQVVSSGRPPDNSDVVTHWISPRYDSVTDERLRGLMLQSGQLAQPENAQLEDMARIIDAWPESERTAPYLVLAVLASNPELRERVGWTIEDVRGVAAGFMSSPSERQQMMLDRVANLESVAWTAGLPSARFARYRSRGPAFEVDSAVPAEVLRTASIYSQDCVEWMAEAYQLSSGLRARSNLTPPERLPLLYRLQAGERRLADRDLLKVMLQDQETVEMAQGINRGEISARSLEHISAMDQSRQDRAREGNFSRAELDAQRQATQALNFAAGRPAALTRARALQQSRDHLIRPPSASVPPLAMGGPSEDTYGDAVSEDGNGSETEDCGLDAPDSGRPAAKADEEMTVRMDCRVCYTQLAEIACLPCGHLVMCRWCSDQHSPTMQHDRTRPRRATGCPVCRKGIRQKVRVFRA
nr:hypothetical protein CFP56_03301 [Quercus suber]